ncbi:selenocysteine-specific translation elongation factor [Eggerthellaceae bacterium zg-1084]|uniref:selenocysteine-specific translation elongation factor n=1 Tax=Berryella wangjianweii TaxID=2734634 RepID=UPI0015574B4E|nr:selenocysteine-specific translation elongation factor [Berryella wangjianweii]NPD30607.1 selenocysteine-specific translation elongation factor [Berryella wangjianweii]
MSAPARILGTAGHIDHGKSSLIRALTGTDPDRLAEEKSRGITIELGFAQLQLPDGSALGVIDVPGHERFVRQMIAGATGVDLALLCIAADDGVMPQTREHVAVLELLGIRTCVVALTKCDRVDAEWRELMIGEVRAFLRTTSFAQAAIVPTSTRTEEGLDDLRRALAEAAARCEATHARSGARMPVDRVFTIKGAGTVVTGTLWSGAVAVDDELEVLPTLRRARVRSVQIHDQPASEAQAGNRTALNLSGLSTDDIRPGDFLATPGSIEPTDRFDAWFTFLSPIRERKPLKSGARVRIAHGTRETFGRLLLMDEQPSISAHESAYAQIRLEEPLPVSAQDRFIVRSYSPVAVIGGGVVLAAHPRRRTSPTGADRELLDALRAGDADAALADAVRMQAAPFTAADLARATGIQPTAAGASLRDMAGRGELTALGSTGAYCARPVLQRALGAIDAALLKFHAANPHERGVHAADLLARTKLKMSPEAFDAVVALAVSEGKVHAEAGTLSHPKAGAGARAAEEQLGQRMLQVLEAAGSTPPALAELFREAQAGDQSLAYRVVNALEHEGRIVRAGKELAFSAAAFAALEQAVRDHLAQHGRATVAELKDAMGVSRKYAVPLVEALDERRVTRREGDVRVLA